MAAVRLRRDEAGAFTCVALVRSPRLLILRTCFQAERPHVVRLPARGRSSALIQVAGRQVYSGHGYRQAIAPGDVLVNDGRLPYHRATPSGVVAEALHLLPGGALPALPTSAAGSPLLPGIAANVPAVGWLVDQLIRRPGALRAAALGQELLRVVVALLEDSATSAHPSLGVTQGRVQQRLEQALLIERAKALMRANLAAPCRLDDLAAAVGLSPAHFCVVFHRVAGTTPHRYLLEQRLLLAWRLLTDTDWSVTDICYAVGFGQPSHFAASFRRDFGRTPAAHRAANLGQPYSEGRENMASLACAPPDTSRIEGSPVMIPGVPAITPIDLPPYTVPAYARRGSALALRHLALGMAGSGDRRTVQILLPYVRRPDRRRSAVRAIGWVVEGSGDKGLAALAPLTDLPELATDMPELRARALIGESPSKTLATLAPALGSTELAVRRNAVRALGIALRDRASPATLEVLKRQMGDGDGLIDNIGVVSLGLIFRKSGNAAAVSLLRDVLQIGLCRMDHDHTQSPACLCTSSFALALVCRGTDQAPAAAAAIAPMLEADDAAIVSDAIDSLTTLWHGAAPAGLELAPYAAYRPPVGAHALHRLPLLFGGAAPAQAMPAISALLEAPSPAARRAGSTSLGLLYRGQGDGEAVALLRSLLQQPSSKLRGDALLAWGLVQHGRGGDELAYWLAAHPARTPYEARSGLLALGMAYQGRAEPGVAERLVHRLSAANGYVRRAAALGLGLLYQGTAAEAPKQELLAAARRAVEDRLAVDEALLIIDFDTARLRHLSYEVSIPFGDYANSFHLCLRQCARLGQSSWDVDEPIRVA